MASCSRASTETKWQLSSSCSKKFSAPLHRARCRLRSQDRAEDHHAGQCPCAEGLHGHARRGSHRSSTELRPTGIDHTEREWSAVAKSVYVTEAAMGDFERRLINDVANLESVVRRWRDPRPYPGERCEYRMCIRVEQGKGARDRCVPLQPDLACRPLRKHTPEWQCCASAPRSAAAAPCASGSRGATSRPARNSWIGSSCCGATRDCQLSERVSDRAPARRWTNVSAPHAPGPWNSTAGRRSGPSGRASAAPGHFASRP